MLPLGNIGYDPRSAVQDQLKRWLHPDLGLGQPTQASPDEEALLNDYASPGNILTILGNILDTPGSFIRDTLAGENPFPGIFNTSQRKSGRDLLEKWGVLSPNEEGLDAGDVAGFGAELVTDPLLYLSGGYSALTKGAAGKVAEKALGKEALFEALTKRTGTALDHGWREGALTTKLSDIVSRFPEHAADFELAAGSPEALQGLLASEKPLGAATRVGIPLTDLQVNMGTGPVAKGIARGLDTLGERIRWSGPGKVLAALFEHSNANQVTKEGQLFAQEASRELPPELAKVHEMAMGAVDAANSTGLPWDTAASIMRRTAEGVDLPPELIAGIDPAHIETLKGATGSMVAAKDAARQALLDTGYHSPELIDEMVGHFPRYATVADKDNSLWTAVIGKKLDSDFARKRFLKNVRDGSDGINAMTKSLELAGKDSLPLEEVTQRVQDGWVQDPTQAQKMARWLKGLPEGVAGKPYFADPIRDVLKYTLQTTQAAHATRSLLGFMGKHGEEGGAVAFKDMFRRMGLDADKASAHIANSLGIAPEQVMKMGMSEELASDATRMIKTFTSPPAWKAVLNIADKIEQAFKVGVTAPFPGFHVRNKMTALFSDLIAGIPLLHLWGNHRDAYEMLKGAEIGGASKIPAIKAMGLGDKEATEFLARKFAVHNLWRGGQFSQDIKPGQEGLASLVSSAMPGSSPVSIASSLKTLAPDFSGGIKGLMPHPIKAGLEAGNLVEDSSRIASALGLLRQGYSLDAAIAKAKAMHGEYQLMSDFEKSVMKRVVPFYGFARKVLPTFVADLIHNPGGLTGQAIRAERNLSDQAGFIPESVGQGLAVPLGESAPGVQKFVTDSGVIPIENLTDLIKPGHGILDTARKTGEALLGQTNPLLKGTLELMTGKQFYTDRDLRDLKTHFGMPPAAEQVVMNSPLARVLSTTSKFTDPRKSVGEAILNVGTGLRTVDVDMDRARDVAARHAIEDSLRGETGVGSAPSTVFVRKDDKAMLSETDRKLWDLYQGIQKRGRAQAKARKQQQLISP